MQQSAAEIALGGTAKQPVAGGYGPFSTSITAPERFRYACFAFRAHHFPLTTVRS
jgi:hypothetical protein